MQRIYERRLVIDGFVALEPGRCFEVTVMEGVANLVQHLLMQTAEARLRPGQITELHIQVTASEQHIQLGGQVKVAWIVVERDRPMLSSAEVPLQARDCTRFLLEGNCSKRS